MQIKNVDVKVMNKSTVEEYGLQKHDEKSIVISIASKGSAEAFVLANSVANIVDVLKVKFNDTDVRDDYFGCITSAEAKLISDFVKKYIIDDEIKLIIVQCEAGQSRSAGVAGAILKYLRGDDTEIFNNHKFTPNMLCYRTVLNELFDD